MSRRVYRSTAEGEVLSVPWDFLGMLRCPLLPSALFFMAPDLTLPPGCEGPWLSSSQPFLHPLPSVISILLGHLLILSTLSGWHFHFSFFFCVCVCVAAILHMLLFFDHVHSEDADFVFLVLFHVFTYLGHYSVFILKEWWDRFFFLVTF